MMTFEERVAKREREVAKAEERLLQIRKEMEELEKVHPFYRDYERVEQLMKEERENEYIIVGIGFNYEEWL